MKKILIILFLVCSSLSYGFAQRVALKTNLLHDAIASPNLSLELGISPKTTLDLYGAYNPFVFKNNMKWKHWLLQPEYRYWFCERFNGLFLGLHAHGGQYNMSSINMPAIGYLFGDAKFSNLKKYRYEGWFVGAGVSVGYQWILSTRWNLETSIGAGYAFSKFRQYNCGECGKQVGKGDGNYLGLTRATVSLVYLLK